MSGNNGDGQAGGGWLSPFLERQRIAHVMKFIPPQSRILDIGCGRAAILDSLPSVRRYVGVDLLPEVIGNNIHRYPQYTFFSLNIERERVPTTEKFDIIIMLAILEHLFDADSLFSRLNGYLSASGTIVLTTPHPLAEYPHRAGAAVGLFSRDAAEEHIRFFNRSDLYLLSQRIGLVMTDYHRFQIGLNQAAVFRQLP